MLNIRVIAYLVVATVIASIGLYVQHLRSEVTVLTAQLTSVTAQLTAVTEDREAVMARQKQAGRQVEKLRSDLAAARGRVETVVIPGDCPAALDWLANELRSNK